MSKLAKRVSALGFRESVARSRAKLDAEDAGWSVMDLRRARALESVARAADRLRKPPAPCPPICPEWDAMFRALSRLERVSKGGKG